MKRTALYILPFGVVIAMLFTSCGASKKTQNTPTAAITEDGNTTIAAALPSSSQMAFASKDFLLNDSNIKAAHVGISIYDATKNVNVFAYQEDKMFIPASSMKLFTCYAAMRHLGDSLIGFNYVQRNDTLFIKGNGDPTLLHPLFNNDLFLKWMTNKQLHVIGIDDSNWKEAPYGKGWAWDDYNDDYMAERSPLPLYGNLLTFTNGNATPTPLLPNINFTNTNTYKNYTIKRQYNSNSFFYAPAQRSFSQLSIPFITNGATAAAALLKELTQKQTFYRSSTENSHIDWPSTYTSTFSTQPTDSLLKPMMYESDNFFAEQTLLMISNQQLGFMSDEAIVSSLLKNEMSSLPQKPRWVDGSGLSRYNLVSPQDFVWVLQQMKNNISWQRITAILPTGNQGTLMEYYKNLQGKIFAKTGTLTNQVALNGYLITKQNKTFIFSVMVNHHRAPATAIRRSIEKFLVAVYENN